MLGRSGERKVSEMKKSIRSLGRVIWSEDETNVRVQVSRIDGALTALNQLGDSLDLYMHPKCFTSSLLDISYCLAPESGRASENSGHVPFCNPGNIYYADF